MVFLADLEGKDLLFTYGIFGVQHGTIIDQVKKDLILKLYNLLASSAGCVDHLRPEGHGTTIINPSTTTFVAYWLSSEEYAKWFQSAEVQSFWESLPDDAGIWREVMTVPKSRYMFAASQNVKWGLASLIDGLRTSNDEGYWGVYRHRLSDTPDKHTDPSDTFTSPYITASKASAASGNTKPVIDIPERLNSLPDESDIKVRAGRVRITNPPDNMAFVREGQRQPNISKSELDLWLAKISPHARSWIDHLDAQRQKNGVLSFTTHLAADAPVSTDQGYYPVDATSIPETDQLAYFLDLAHFELAGRAHKGHVQLRKTVMEIYGPGGEMSNVGKAELFVELCVLKSGDLDAEYIGCAEGTGLMFLEKA